MGVLSGDSLKNVGMVAGLVVTLWQGWQAGRKAEHADDRAGSAQAFAATSAIRRSHRTDSLVVAVGALAARVAVLERREKSRIAAERSRRRGDTLSAYGPELPPEWYQPKERRGWLSRLLGNS